MHFFPIRNFRPRLNDLIRSYYFFVTQHSLRKYLMSYDLLQNWKSKMQCLPLFPAKMYRFERNIGLPNCMASTTGAPNPSAREGCINAMQ